MIYSFAFAFIFLLRGRIFGSFNCSTFYGSFHFFRFILACKYCYYSYLVNIVNCSDGDSV